MPLPFLHAPCSVSPKHGADLEAGTGVGAARTSRSPGSHKFSITFPQTTQPLQHRSPRPVRLVHPSLSAERGRDFGEGTLCPTLPFPGARGPRLTPSPEPRLGRGPRTRHPRDPRVGTGSPRSTSSSRAQRAERREACGP